MLTGLRKPEYELFMKKTTGSSSLTSKLVEGVDYQIRGSYATSRIDAAIVFLGYGIKNEQLKSDPYRRIDVQGKIVFIIEGFPGSKDSQSENYKILLSDGSVTQGELERNKIKLAEENGAVAIIRYNPYQETMVSDAPSNLPFFYNEEYYEGDTPKDDYYLKRLRLPNWDDGSGIPVIQVNKATSELILDKLLQQSLAPGYNLASFRSSELENSRLDLNIINDQKVIKVRNVLGYIEGENPHEAIVIGAHFDHVGKYNGFIFNGADDNASGTAGVLALARAFSEKGVKPQKTIIFAAWTAEEQGLWGSKYFVKNRSDSIKIVLNVNLDMISRTDIKDSTGNYLSFLYTKGHEEFEKIFTEINHQNNFDLQLACRSQIQPRGGSDFASFAEHGIPIISLFTGLHKDYHMPNDEFEFLDIDKMVKIIRLTYLGVNRILEEDAL